MLWCWGFTATARAQDSKAAAAQLSDRGFALLNSLSASGANPALGPVASFAGDAQALSSALGSGDHSGAGRAMAALLSDVSAVDAAVSAHPGSLNASEWKSIKQQVDKLAEQVKPDSRALAAGLPAGEANKPPAGAEPESAPKVRIDSYTVKGRSVRIKGFFEGRALKSAGIYEGEQLQRPIKLDDVPGRQHVSFDIELAGVEPGMTLRVYDGAGLSAEAPIASRLGIEGTGGAKEVELGPPSEAPVSLGGETVSDETDAAGHNVAEIPARPSSSRRHSGGAAHSRLGDIQVQIFSVSLDDPLTRTYDVIGQISGTGVERAGIYVDANPVKDIDVDFGDAFITQPFDETFQMNGNRATIRVYGPREQYLESSLHLGAAPVAPPVIALNPNQLGVQISALRPIAPNVMAVSGALLGRNLASAGLYQNGLLVQPLSVSAGLLSALAPGAFRQVSFTAQFNPTVGPASVRVFDTGGQFAEQPVMVAGVNPYLANPYQGPVNPYGPAVNPYGRGANPYGGPNPYGYPNPYGPRYGAPYGNPAPPKVPWWLKLLMR